MLDCSGENDPLESEEFDSPNTCDITCAPMEGAVIESAPVDDTVTELVG